MISKTFQIAKGEFYRYFISPLAYVYLVCFLLLNSSFALYFGGIFTSGNASLHPMFAYLPWILLLFIPGIAMRLWAEEFKSGTILQTMTLPIPAAAWVWGKFFAAWVFCTLALLLTFPFIITVNLLGKPDNFVIFNSYLGAFLLSGAMLAISQTASALTKNQVIALVIAFFINLLFFLSGLEYVLGFFRNFAPDYIIDMISSFSFLTHAANFNLGIFELRDLIFFASLILMFNFFTVLIIVFKTSGILSWLKTTSVSGGIIAALLIFASFVGINLFANNTLRQWRIDFTEEQLFTPSNSTRKILQNLPAPVTAKVYYSPILGERDEQMRLFFDKLRLTLQTYRDISDGKFNYLVYNPEPLSDTEDRAITAGLQALPVPDLNAAAYFGIVFVNENGKSQTLPFLPLSRQNLLEQDLTENIYLMEHQKKTLGLLTSLPLLGNSVDNIILPEWKIASELKKYYDIKPVKNPKDLENIDILLIAHPQSMPKDMERAIYDYSVDGGKILAFFDIAAEALKLAGPQTKLSHQSDYGTLPEKWGFRFFDNAVVADLDNSSEISIETADYAGTTQDLIQFYLMPSGFTSGLPETRNLKRMLVTSASIFMPLKDAPTHFIPLIQASDQSELLSSEVVTQNIHPAEILRHFKADNRPKIIAAHILGKNNNQPLDIIIVGDSDMLYDSFWTTSALVGNQQYNIPLLDNGNFVLNALDVLSGSTLLLDLRGKSRTIRPFTTLDKQQKQILRRFKIKEKDIFDKIGQIKRGLNEIWNKKTFEGRHNFTPEELSIINKIKKDLEQQRHELFAIRTELNDNLKKIEFWVKFFDIYSIPCLIILGALLFKLRRIRFGRPAYPQFNRCFGIVLIVSVICISLGFGSIWLLPEKNSVIYEGRPLFPDLASKINEVEQLVIKTVDKQLTFAKQNNIWILKEQPDFLVNQNRIRSFLTSLLQASIYEKKADKLENLPRFGLLPLNNPSSSAVSVSLNSGSGKPLLSFEIGDYNIELSRGSLGAYIRLPEQFQIWLAAIELIDLNLDFHNWTYASLWNLGFGRFSTINGNNNADDTAPIVGLFLNTPLKATTDTPKTQEPILHIHASGEYFKDLELAFYEQAQNFYVQFRFNGAINNAILQAFADKMQGRFYQISAQDMKELINAVNPATSK